MSDLAKLGLKASEKPLRNLAGNMLEKAASYGAKEIRGGQQGGRLDMQKALAPLGELHLRTLPGFKKYITIVDPVRGDKGINRLDEVCEQHDINYDNSDMCNSGWNR